MTKLARFTLTTALMGSLALPALAQSSATSGVLMQPTAKAVPGQHHRAARNPHHVHHIADTVRTPAVTSGSIPAAPAAVPSKGPAVNGNTAMTSPAPALSAAPHTAGTTASPALPRVQ
jgi:hypothetical protein